MLRIGIIGSGFVPGGTGGTETYFRNLVAALQKVDTRNEYVIMVRPEYMDELHITATNFSLKPLAFRASFLRRVVNKGLKTLGVSGTTIDKQLSSSVDAQGFDLVHFPFQILSPWGVKTKSVLSFMDMQQEYWPQFFSTEELASRARTYRPSAEAATHIIAISDFSKQTLIDKYHIPEEKITSIHISYNEALYDAKATASSKLDLPPHYFYYPAATWPHKNHSRLLEAFSIVHAKHPRFQLVLTGISMQQTDAIKHQLKELGLTKAVTMLGYLPYEDLPSLYHHAYALVFPSLFEGFGIPLCEAMASGCPILGSNTTSVPEVGGKAAVYFDPLDPKDIAKQMIWLIEHPDKCSAMIAAGKKRVRLFSSDSMAQKTIQVYERVAQS